MRFLRRVLLAVLALSLGAFPALAQKRGGVLLVPHVDTPPSPSIQEEADRKSVV